MPRSSRIQVSRRTSDSSGSRRRRTRNRTQARIDERTQSRIELGRLPASGSYTVEFGNSTVASTPPRASRDPVASTPRNDPSSIYYPYDDPFSLRFLLHYARRRRANRDPVASTPPQASRDPVASTPDDPFSLEPLMHYARPRVNMTKAQIKEAILESPTDGHDNTFLRNQACIICLESFRDILLLKHHLVAAKCGHIFCNECASKHIKFCSKTCPSCRHELEGPDYFFRLHLPMHPMFKKPKHIKAEPKHIKAEPKHIKDEPKHIKDEPKQ